MQNRLRSTKTNAYEVSRLYTTGRCTEVPVDPERTIFRLGSVTKVLTGVAVTQLVDRGLLDLDADVNDYLTELEVPWTLDEARAIRYLFVNQTVYEKLLADG